MDWNWMLKMVRSRKVATLLTSLTSRPSKGAEMRRTKRRLATKEQEKVWSKSRRKIWECWECPREEPILGDLLLRLAKTGGEEKQWFHKITLFFKKCWVKYAMQCKRKKLDLVFCPRRICKPCNGGKVLCCNWVLFSQTLSHTARCNWVLFSQRRSHSAHSAVGLGLKAWLSLPVKPTSHRPLANLTRRPLKDDNVEGNRK